MGPKRKTEMWTSHNRVLNGGNKKYNGRNPNFDTEETKLLISLWGDPKVQKTLITTHKKHPVICRLAEQLREYGYHRSAEEINTRIKNLKCFYNRIKKDIEMGIITAPTWKHFTAMDRIMTRPIFSVRPNEIPKPSPRFKMEEVKVREPPPTDNNKENDGSDDDDEFFTQEMLETEMTCSDDLEVLDERMDDSNHEEKEGDIKTANDLQQKRDEDSNSSLIVPKEEPFDVDDDDEAHEDDARDVEESTDIFPKLSAYLQLASTNVSTASSATKPNNKIITTIAGTTTNSSEVNTSIANALKMGQPMMFTQQQSQQGKISLVPTNFLLKPQQQQIQLRPQAQHILYNPGMAGNSSIATSVAGQMSNGMKVILVNALQKGGVTAANSPADSQTKLVMSNAIKASCITSTVPTVQESRTKPLEPKNEKPGTGAGFRSLISKLIDSQNENLKVSRQRLELERQRFDFEKTLAERIIAALPNIFPPQDDTTMPLLKPKIEKED